MKVDEKTIDGRSLRSILTRQKLLYAARELFYEVGFEKTTISQIIKRAKTGYGTAYVHFKGKDDILIMLMENVLQEFLEIADTPFLPKSKEEAKQLILKQVTAFLNMAKTNEKILKAELVARSWFFTNENYQWDIIQNVETSPLEEIALPFITVEMEFHRIFV
ncbi:TetR family transcriptional regulator [Solibacillus sp. R5-41]|uniref:TetR/AcrR family transcriptional regulator n=1 Tax=Solibacillus sp. R5-41 TaxID=2048654 RepID=UPI000C12621E|nr:TetR/AcrR family transcriptional regulator [Solibacillus sp. R5-41]ATP41077.1 TetR family transcriptional regulator [Solibacillus sp. R5-41]